MSPFASNTVMKKPQHPPGHITLINHQILTTNIVKKMYGSQLRELKITCYLKTVVSFARMHPTSIHFAAKVLFNCRNEEIES